MTSAGLKQCVLALFLVLLLTPLPLWAAPAEQRPLLAEMQVPDTCGTAYGDHLAVCTPFRCQRPHPFFAINAPTEAEMSKMTDAQKQKAEAYQAEVEKKLQEMTPAQRAEKKAKMVVTFEIKGPDAQGLCQTTTSMTAKSRQDCALDEETRQDIADFDRLVATADSIKTKSSSELVEGKMVTKTLTTVDGKTIENPWQHALNSGQCKILDRGPDGSWTPMEMGVIKKTPVKKTSESNNTLFILDASGSMWGQIKGTPKITIAKEVMAKLVPELPSNSRIGLIAYGHRRKGDCNDVETLVKLGANHQQAVLDAVKGLNALGKTPLTKSVTQAFKMLQSEKQASTIILVSDGIESCNADPCKAVAAAKKDGLKFILHTVGFGLSKEESAQLQCMAKAGDGEYFQASNAKELLKSTRKAVKSKGPGMLKLTLRANGKPVNAWVKLVGNGEIGLTELTNDTGVKPAHIWHLKPGVYHLETLPAGLQGVDPIKLDNIKIESGKTVEKTLDFDQSTLHITATENGKQAVVQIRVKNVATNKTVFDTSTYSTFTMNGVKTPYDVKLLPGKYRLIVQIPNSSITPYSEENDVLSGGMTVEKTVVFESGTMRVTVLVGGKAATAEVNIRKAGSPKDIFATMPYVGDATPMNVKLDAGHYDLYVIPVGIEGMVQKVIKNIELKSDSVVDEVLSFEVKPIAADANGLEQNTDRPGGGDFKHIIPASDDAALCQKACQDDALCKAWTYVKPNTLQGPQPNCWLKTSAPHAVPNSCCVSGTK
ncbi:VWA domain-containing protein [Geopsychrobacter electrodiphilus]|uniref:VWA domain-containing protein n=1 Tax=Geopsychrobacter electrodiphilus TaxID=225196 RepID=UPI0003741F1E|nr:VWA domain-containing protein [Geopsychrobacter electrodiphilus]